MKSAYPSSEMALRRFVVPHPRPKVAEMPRPCRYSAVLAGYPRVAGSLKIDLAVFLSRPRWHNIALAVLGAAAAEFRMLALPLAGTHQLRNAGRTDVVESDHKIPSVEVHLVPFDRSIGARRQQSRPVVPQWYHSFQSRCRARPHRRWPRPGSAPGLVCRSRRLSLAADKMSPARRRAVSFNSGSSLSGREVTPAFPCPLHSVHLPPGRQSTGPPGPRVPSA